MSDPHVIALRYRFVSVNEHDRFGEAAPKTFTASGFDLHLSDGVLEVKPHGHLATAEEARAEVEPILADWAAQARLERPRRRIRFDFEDAEIIERVQDGIVVRPPTIRINTVVAEALIVVDNPVYPAEPTGFRTDGVLDTILARLWDLDADRTNLTDAANWVLTKVEDVFGGPLGATSRRRTAAQALALHDDILSNLGRLGSQNDPEVGRKARGPEKPFTRNETAWMRAVIVLIARQIGTHNAGAALLPKSMNDLPPIP